MTILASVQFHVMANLKAALAGNTEAPFVNAEATGTGQRRAQKHAHGDGPQPAQLQRPDRELQLLQAFLINAVADPLHVRRSFDQPGFLQDRDVVGDRRRCQGKHVSQTPEITLAVVDKVPQQLNAGRMRDGPAHARKVFDIDPGAARARGGRGTAGLGHNIHSLFDEDRIGIRRRCCQSLWQPVAGVRR